MRWRGGSLALVVLRSRCNANATSSSIKAHLHLIYHGLSHRHPSFPSRLILSWSLPFAPSSARLPQCLRLSASRNTGPVQPPACAIAGRNIPSRRRQAGFWNNICRLAIPRLSHVGFTVRTAVAHQPLLDATGLLKTNLDSKQGTLIRASCVDLCHTC
jgi:hypothetical protein